MGKNYNSSRLVNGLSVDASGNVTINSGKIFSNQSNSGTIIESTSTTSGWLNMLRATSTGANLSIWIENSTGGDRAVGSLAYAGGLCTYTNTALQFGTNNNIRMTLTGTGNVGIGTTSASAKLEIKGDGASTGKTFRTTDSAGNEVFVIQDGGLAYFKYGSVLIGSATAKWSSIRGLELNGAEVIYGMVNGTTSLGYIYHNGTNLYISNELLGSYDMIFNVNGAARIRIKSDGNVGINTSNPIYKFQTYSTASDWGNLLQSSAGTEQVNTYISHGGGYGIAVDSTANSDGVYLLKLNGGNGGSGQGAIEHLKVLSSGSLLMGTAGTKSYIRMGRFSSSTTNSGEAWIGRASDRPAGVMTVQLGSSSSTNFEVVDYAWSKVVFSVTGAGNGSMYGSLTQNSSDERLKENIQNIPNALDKIKSINGVTFNWKKDGVFDTTKTTDVGVIAQQIQSVLPDAVTLAPFDTNHNTGESLSGQNYLTVYYEKIIPLLIEGIKEQQAQIEELKAQINK